MVSTSYILLPLIVDRPRIIGITGSASLVEAVLTKRSKACLPVMIVDSIDYGGQYEQRAISTGLRVDTIEVRFDFNYGHTTEYGQAIGRGFVNDDQTQAIYRVIITSAGVLTYSYTSLE